MSILLMGSSTAAMTFLNVTSMALLLARPNLIRWPAASTLHLSNVKKFLTLER